MKATDVRPPTGTPGGSGLGVRIGYGWVVLSSLAIASFFTLQYALGSLEDLADRGIGLAEAYAGQPAAVKAAFYVHVVSAGLALLLGPWQFSRRLRTRHTRWHRRNGRVVVTCILVGSVTGMALAPFNSVGLLGFFGFAPLAVLWGWCGWRGYRAARTQDFAEHQAWMIRAFALTYAAVTLRLWFGVLILVQLPFAGSGDVDQVLADAYAPVAYLAWIPNLIVAELIIHRRHLPGLRWARDPEARSPVRASGAR